MNETMNACHVAPAGYTRAYHAMRAHGCQKHADYTIFCQSCEYRVHEVPVTLGARDEFGDMVLALIIDEDGDVIEWITEDTSADTARTVVECGELVVMEHAPASVGIDAAMNEARLRADCFALKLSDMRPSMDAVSLVVLP